MDATRFTGGGPKSAGRALRIDARMAASEIRYAAELSAQLDQDQPAHRWEDQKAEVVAKLRLALRLLGEP